MDRFITWNELATFAGATALTSLLTQFLKDLFRRLPTQWLSYFIALTVLAAATAATQGLFLWADWAIIPVNAVIVSLSANGAFSAVKRITGNSSLIH